MNMQTKLYTIQILTTQQPIRSQSLSSDRRTHGFPRAHEFHRFCQT